MLKPLIDDFRHSPVNAPRSNPSPQSAADEAWKVFADLTGLLDLPALNFEVVQEKNQELYRPRGPREKWSAHQRESLLDHERDNGKRRGRARKKSSTAATVEESEIRAAWKHPVPLNAEEIEDYRRLIWHHSEKWSERGKRLHAALAYLFPIGSFRESASCPACRVLEMLVSINREPVKFTRGFPAEGRPLEQYRPWPVYRLIPELMLNFDPPFGLFEDPLTDTVLQGLEVLRQVKRIQDGTGASCIENILAAPPPAEPTPKPPLLEETKYNLDKARASYKKIQKASKDVTYTKSEVMTMIGCEDDTWFSNNCLRKKIGDTYPLWKLVRHDPIDRNEKGYNIYPPWTQPEVERFLKKFIEKYSEPTAR